MMTGTAGPSGVTRGRGADRPGWHPPGVDSRMK